MNTPTVGQTSGFRSHDIHTKFPTRPLNKNVVRGGIGYGGYFNKKFMKALGIETNVKAIIQPVIEPQYCTNCQSPMQLCIRKKGNVELGIKPIVGYTCNRGNTGCQNAKAKKYIGNQRIKKFMARTSDPKVKHVVGVRLENSMIHARQ